MSRLAVLSKLIILLLGILLCQLDGRPNSSWALNNTFSNNMTSVSEILNSKGELHGYNNDESENLRNKFVKEALLKLKLHPLVNTKRVHYNVIRPMKIHKSQYKEVPITKEVEERYLLNIKHSLTKDEGKKEKIVDFLKPSHQVLGNAGWELGMPAAFYRPNNKSFLMPITKHKEPNIPIVVMEPFAEDDLHKNYLLNNEHTNEAEEMNTPACKKSYLKKSHSKRKPKFKSPRTHKNKHGDHHHKNCYHRRNHSNKTRIDQNDYEDHLKNTDDESFQRDLEILQQNLNLEGKEVHTNTLLNFILKEKHRSLHKRDINVTTQVSISDQGIS